MKEVREGIAIDKASQRFTVLPRTIDLDVGETVWVIERDEDLSPTDVTGLLFLAEVKGYVISAPFPYGYELAADQLEYFAERTREAFNEDLMVHPVADCYTCREDAEAAAGVQA